jgi:hypothetical protein
MKFLSRR